MSGEPAAVHTIARIALDDGGPARTVVALCRAMAALGARVEVVTGEVDDCDSGVPVHAAGTIVRWGRAQPRSGAFARLLNERLEETGARVVHDHGIWLASNHAVARVAARLRVPRIVSPRGMLSDWALAWRAWKKRVAWWSFQRHDLRTADLLHATSDLEAGEIRAAGIGVPIAVVPNGVDLPPMPARRPHGADRTRRFLFLSRIHPKKGLENLLEAWRIARPPGWELVIAGPDEEGHRARIEERARALGAGPPVRFLDAVPDGGKWEAFGAADVFVLPTLSENFGVVVAEALAGGIPAITTRAAPWEELRERRCGWWTDVGIEPLVAAIRAAAEIGDEERAAMGARGRRLIEERYAWPAIARRMLSVYRWLAGESGEPDFIRRA